MENDDAVYQRNLQEAQQGTLLHFCLIDRTRYLAEGPRRMPAVHYSLFKLSGSSWLAEVHRPARVGLSALPTGDPVILDGALSVVKPHSKVHIACRTFHLSPCHQ